MTASSTPENDQAVEIWPPLADWTIRELVERYPETMTVLGPLGIDLCCGGAHRLGEALDLHGLERGAVITQVAAAVAAGRGEER